MAVMEQLVEAAQEGASFAGSVVQAYTNAQPDGDFRLDSDGWLALLGAVSGQRGFTVPREQLLQL